MSTEFYLSTFIFWLLQRKNEIKGHLKFVLNNCTIWVKEEKQKNVKSSEKIYMKGEKEIWNQEFFRTLRQYCHPFSDVSGNTYLLFVKGNIGWTPERSDGGGQYCP